MNATNSTTRKPGTLTETRLLDLTPDEIVLAIGRIKDAAQLARISNYASQMQKHLMKRAFRKGDLAAFDAKGKTFVGICERVNQKTVTVSDTLEGMENGRNHYQMGYRVSPTILREPTEKERADYRAWRTETEKDPNVFLVFDGRINYGI